MLGLGAPLTFDFGLDMGKGGDDPLGLGLKPPAAKEKGEGKRLARCGKCTNCTRSDCGSCYNCADKPKFGGPGVKKQACINRKCLLMGPKDEEDQRGVVRKRSKQRAEAPLAIKSPAEDTLLDHAGANGPRPQLWADSPGSSRASTSSPVEDWLSEAFTEETNDAADLGDAPEEFLGMDTLALDGERDGLNPAAKTTPLEDWITPATDDEGNRPAPATLEVAVSARDSSRGDWKWFNALLLQEEFLSLNEQHRRASQWAPPIPVF